MHSVIYPGEGSEEDRDVVVGFDKVRCSMLMLNTQPIGHRRLIQLKLSYEEVFRRLVTKARKIPSSGGPRGE